MGKSYVLGPHFLVLASHIPPALMQAACVFIFVKSAAKAGAVKATASPSERIAATNLVMTLTPPCVCGPEKPGNTQQTLIRYEIALRCNDAVTE
jgi:hypothetical protein